MFTSVRIAALSLGLFVMSACDASPQSHGSGKSADTGTRPPTSRALRGIKTETLTARAGDRSYVKFSRSGATLAVRVSRPSKADPRLLLSVAGTYTSPEDKVLGIVMLDGNLVEKKRMAWDGLLAIVDGSPSIQKATRADLSPERLKAFESKKASLLQGHLLVHRGKPEPYKPSPYLPRRALAIFDDGEWAIIESAAPVELQSLANDLAELGAAAALNLDMGGWSEGWYRDSAGSLVSLGVPHPSTERQTNWLVIKN